VEVGGSVFLTAMEDVFFDEEDGALDGVFFVSVAGVFFSVVGGDLVVVAEGTFAAGGFALGAAGEAMAFVVAGAGGTPGGVFTGTGVGTRSGFATGGGGEGGTGGGGGGGGGVVTSGGREVSGGMRTVSIWSITPLRQRISAWVILALSTI
jgi:hypothetical protein